jgi:hypothetical protein
MATIDRTPTRQQLAEARSKVRHPLAALRGYIRSYVTLEGVAFFLIFLFVWFWIGLLLDYVVLHKLLGVDYVRWLPFSGVAGKIFRIGILGGLLAWLVTKLIFMVVVRLFRDFSDSAMALLLERRYPEELGDRLITAVELSDPEKAAMQGYSADMVEETIQEASQRVKQLPVRGVFDWGRLFVRGLVILCLGLFGYAIAVGLFHITKPYQPNRPGLSGIGSFHDVAFIWAERNIMLQDTPWPRDVQLVPILPDRDGFRIGSNKGKTPIRYRVLKYVIADPSVPEGWRPLLIEDLQARPELLGEGAPTPPADWRSKYTPEINRGPAALGGELAAGEILASTAPLGALPEFLLSAAIVENEMKSLRGKLSLDEAELLYARSPIKANEPGQGPHWTIRDLQAEVYRPLLWAELATGSFTGITIPKLDTTWDPNAGPIHIAAVWGLSALGVEQTQMPTWASLLLGPATSSGLTVDQVEKKLVEMEKTIPAEQRSELMRDLRTIVFDRLERIDAVRQVIERAPDALQRPELSRTVRVLNLPDQIDFVSTIKNSDTRVTLSRSRETNEYNHQLDLPNRSETVSYFARAADYTTPTRTIEVIGPPQLLNLYSDEMQPAYLFYRWGQEKQPGVFDPAVSPMDLVGLKQRIDGRDRLNAGGTLSRIEVPAGTDLTLRAKAERKLEKVEVTQGKGPKLPSTLVINGPDRTDEFTIVLPNVRDDAVFTIDMVDLDGVSGSRNVVIKVLQDSPPDLPDTKPAEIIRKNKEGMYLVTPDARIPFVGQVIDDRGISGIRYAYTVEPVELIPKLNGAVLSLVLASYASAGIRGEAPLTSVPLFLEAIGRHHADEAERIANVQVVRMPNIPGVVKAIRDFDTKQNPFLPLAEIKELLSQPKQTPYRPMLRQYNLMPDYSLPADKPPFFKWDNGRGDQVNDFLVDQARFQNKKLKVIGDNVFQPRYKVQIWVEGLDTDVEGGRDRDGLPTPHITPSKDRYTFLVVPEYELLLEINKSEEALNYRLIQLSRESGKSWEADSLTKMENDLGNDLVQLAAANVKTPEIRQMAARIKVMKENLLKGQTYTQDVLNDYKMLILEMEMNRIDENKLAEKRRDVVTPLEKVINEAFPTAQKSMEKFEGSLYKAGEGTEPNAVALTRARQDGTTAQADLRQLHGDLEAVIQALEQVANLAKEIEKLKKIADRKQAESELYVRLKELRIRIELGDPEPKPKPKP